jgi:hypothetical protein
MIRIEGLITLSADKSGLAEHAQAILCFNSDNNPFLFVSQPAGNRRLEPGHQAFASANAPSRHYRSFNLSPTNHQRFNKSQAHKACY